MSKRQQVLLDEPEWREVQRVARARQLTVEEWVRQSLRAARARQPRGDVGRKLEVVRAAGEKEIMAFTFSMHCIRARWRGTKRPDKIDSGRVGE